MKEVICSVSAVIATVVKYHMLSLFVLYVLFIAVTLFLPFLQCVIPRGIHDQCTKFRYQQCDLLLLHLVECYHRLLGPNQTFAHTTPMIKQTLHYFTNLYKQLQYES